MEPVKRMSKFCGDCPFRIECLTDEPGGACLLVREITYLMIENEMSGNLKSALSTLNHSEEEVKKREKILEKFENYILYANVYEMLDAAVERQLLEGKADV